MSTEKAEPSKMTAEKAELVNLYKKKRSTLRTSVTKIISKIEIEIKKTEVTDESEIELFIEQLNDKFESLKLVDSDLEKILKPEDLDKELASAEEYHEKIVTWRFKANKYLRNLNQKKIIQPLDPPHHSSNEVNVKNQTLSVKLPKIMIPKFSGNISEWLTFWNSFETSIHNNDSLDNVSKFNYLKAHLTGTALETIGGFSISQENYLKAIDLLEQRFGRKETLINTHMSQLLEIPPLKRSSDVKCFRQIYDKIQINIRSLESLGVSSDAFSTLLSPVILKSLTNDLIFEFNKEFGDKYSINDLIEFLNKQLIAKEKTELLKQSQNTQPQTPNVNNLSSSWRRAKGNNENKNDSVRKAAASELFVFNSASKSLSCLFCGGESSHSSFNCEYAKNLPLEKRKEILRKGGFCYRCLKKYHRFNSCTARVKCSICGKRHVDVMHYDEDKHSRHEKPEKEIVENTTLSNNSCSREVFLQTLIVHIKENNLKHLIRVIIDMGSQRSYISKFLAENMNLKGLGKEFVNHGLFGGIERVETHKRYHINLSNVDGSYNCVLEVLDEKKICASLPRINDAHCLSQLRDMGILFSDAMVNDRSCLYEKNSDEIHLLIGADYAAKLLTGKIEHLSGGLVAVHTLLGWTVMGKSDMQGTSKNSSLLVLSLHVNDAKITDLWNLDSLGIKDSSEKRSKTETQELALDYFRETVNRDSTGRYKVNLPWLDGHPPLLDNKELAQKRLRHTVKSLRSVNRLDEYQEVFNQWERDGIIEQVDEDNDNSKVLGVHYLPHRAVFKDNSTTKVRPVFDGSAKIKNSVSINECIEKGPNLIEMIPAILNRFRWGKIGVISDIKQAFLQIGLNEVDRDFLRFIWWKDGDPQKIVTYRHCRVVFGISCSPFLLAAVLNHVLDQVDEPLKSLAIKLKESMYVDNCVASVDSISELEHFRSEAKKILKTAEFDLRGWKNSYLPEMSEPVQDSSDFEKEISVLGLKWDMKDDTLSCELVEKEDKGEPITKRKILSVAHHLFDPIGFTCPITLIPKLLLQECWKLGISWDSKLPEDIIKKFEKWRDELSELRNLKIPRRLSDLDLCNSNLTLHIFCDASQSAYATCIFLRAEKQGTVTCQLIQARSRVTPLKKLSIPRLELLACNIGARLADSVKKSLKLADIESVYWSDSMDALYWIKREGPWMTFVSNRVNEIRRLSAASDWKFVPGVKNPADVPSRECSIKSLLKKQWHEGPSWLKDSRDKWPDFELLPDENTVYAEKKKIIVSSLNKKNDAFYNDISSYKKLIRITGWIYRFCENSKTDNKERGELSKEELKRAEIKILKKVQEDSFQGDKMQRLKPLLTFTDADGIMRIKTKLTMREDTENFKAPIVLPSDHHVVKCLILSKHQELGHPGVPLLMVALRENYWIVKSRRTIKKVIKTCVICQRFSVKKPIIPEGTLPEDRVKDASIFEIIGVDVAGPLVSKDNKKMWIAIFTCAIYRAVHLELLMSLSTDNFILALRRFISRRGRPSIIYSDNGTNFIGTENCLKTINLERLKTSFSSISWKFIPPAAPWWGGFWERLVGLLKRILRKVLGRTSLDYQEIETVLCDCESQLNSRPLTYVTDDPDDLCPLTPDLFLKETHNSSTMDLDRIKLPDKSELNKRLVYRRRLMSDLRVRFRNEYLSQLRQRMTVKKPTYNPKIGDIVLIWNDNLKRVYWPLGRILSVYASKDGIIRRARIKTKSGVITRPIQKLCPLELDGDNLTNETQVQVNPEDDSRGVDFPNSTPWTTRAGRIARPPSRYEVLSFCSTCPETQKGECSEITSSNN